MLAYCTALGLDRGHLVYAKGAAEPYRHVVRGAGIESCHRPNRSVLSNDPRDRSFDPTTIMI
jgi:hypothetical protein